MLRATRTLLPTLTASPCAPPLGQTDILEQPGRGNAQQEPGRPPTSQLKSLPGPARYRTRRRPREPGHPRRTERALQGHARRPRVSIARPAAAGPVFVTESSSRVSPRTRTLSAVPYCAAAATISRADNRRTRSTCRGDQRPGHARDDCHGLPGGASSRAGSAPGWCSHDEYFGPR